MSYSPDPISENEIGHYDGNGAQASAANPEKAMEVANVVRCEKYGGRS